MGTLNYFRLFLLSLAVSACATEPAQRPIGAQSAAIGIDVQTRAPVRIISKYQRVVYFIRVDEENGLFQTHGVLSNYEADGRVYRLNAKPGRYVAVASRHTLQTRGGGRIHYTTYFPIDLINQTEVSVKPGEFAFMGRYVVDQLAVNFGGADDTQRHYLRVIDPAAVRTRSVGETVSEIAVELLRPRRAWEPPPPTKFNYPGRVHESSRTHEAGRLFFTEAKTDLAKSGWIGMIDRELSGLAPRPGESAR